MSYKLQSDGDFFLCMIRRNQFQSLRKIISFDFFDVVTSYLNNISCSSVTPTPLR